MTASKVIAALVALALAAPGPAAAEAIETDLTAPAGVSLPAEMPRLSVPTLTLATPAAPEALPLPAVNLPGIAAPAEGVLQPRVAQPDASFSPIAQARSAGGAFAQPANASVRLGARYDGTAPSGDLPDAVPFAGGWSVDATVLAKAAPRAAAPERAPARVPLVARAKAATARWSPAAALLGAALIAPGMAWAWPDGPPDGYIQAMQAAQHPATAAAGQAAASSGSVWPIFVLLGGFVAAVAGIVVFLQWKDRRAERLRGSLGSTGQAEGADTATLSIAPRVFRRSRKQDEEKPQDKKVTFADVAGQDEAKLELQKVVRFLKNPEKYRKLNPNFKGFKGILLYGPPGTGKTLIARAVASEAGAAFVHRAGSDFINTYVGTGANNVRSAFEETREKARQEKDGAGTGILFIDELDAIGGVRGGGKDNSEETRTINALLSEMDGFEKDNIVVIAATNRPDTLDSALTRGGRFGLKVPVGLPDLEGRKGIFKVHTRGMSLAPDVDVETLAKHTPGISGADIEHIVQDATILAAERDADAVAMADFTLAVDRLTIGHERKLGMNQEEKSVVAYHESGHALVSHLLPNADPVRKVTIVPMGLGALGLMQSLPEEERFLQSRAWLLDRIATALGGRVAEEMMTGEVYSGAANDFEQATRLAKLMVMKFGMVPEVGYVSYDIEHDRVVGRPLSEEKNRQIDAAVKTIIDGQAKRVRELLEANRASLQAMHDELMVKETLRSDDLDRLIPNGKKTPAVSR